MTLTQKEKTVIMDLQTQEQLCIDKYEKYANQASDPVLKDLFNTIKEDEQMHYDSLGQVLKGTVPECDCNDSKGANYEPTPTYTKKDTSPEKTMDAFLVTDCIGTEKLVSHEYNSDVFNFTDSKIRKLLADIQVEEQNHADMMCKYKTANGIA